MPSKSKSQQRFFGMVDAYKKGELKNPSKKIKDTAKSMSMSDVKDFAETKHNKLPEKVEESMKKVIRLTEGDLHRIIKESVKRILRENTDESFMWYLHPDAVNPDDARDEKDFDERTRYRRNWQHDAAEREQERRSANLKGDSPFARLWAHDHPEAPDETRERMMDLHTRYRVPR